MIISHGIWWLLRIQSCTHEKEESLLLLNLFRSHVRNCQSASQSHLKPNKRGHLSKLLIIDTADPEKKKRNPAPWLLPICKSWRILLHFPLPLFSLHSFFELNLFGSTSGCPLYFSPSVTWAGHKASTLSIVVTNACHYCDTVAMKSHITLS